MSRVWIGAGLICLAGLGCTGIVEDGIAVPAGGSGGADGGTVGTFIPTGGAPAPGDAGSAGITGGGGSAGGGGSPGPGNPPADGGSRGNGGSGGGCAGGALPSDVEAVLKARCQLCHGNPPIPGVPASLVTYDDLRSPSKLNPRVTLAEAVVARVNSATMPMPPAPAAPLTTTERQTVQSWIEAGMPRTGCLPGSADGGAGSGDARPGPGPNPYDTPPMCSSGVTRNGGGGSSLMRPGNTCIACHRGNEGPDFAAAGTVFPTAHEPTNCVGIGRNGEGRGAMVVVTDSTGRTATSTVNSSGNFYFGGRLVPPLRAKVVYMGRERLMLGMVPTGDCNSCHTQSGANKAPGRIMFP